MSSVISGNFLSTVGRRKTAIRLRTMQPIIPINRSKGKIVRGEKQKCLDCKVADGVKQVFFKSWQPISQKYKHQEGCISERKL